MRLIFRILGTWLLGVAFILIIIDGTKSLSENAVVITSLAENWAMVHIESLDAFAETVNETMPAEVWDQIVVRVLGWPGWAVIGVPGLLLALAGRGRSTRMRHYTQV